MIRTRDSIPGDAAWNVPLDFTLTSPRRHLAFAGPDPLVSRSATAHTTRPSYFLDGERAANVTPRSRRSYGTSAGHRCCGQHDRDRSLGDDWATTRHHPRHRRRTVRIRLVSCSGLSNICAIGPCPSLPDPGSSRRPRARATLYCMTLITRAPLRPPGPPPPTSPPGDAGLTASGSADLRWTPRPPDGSSRARSEPNVVAPTERPGCRIYVPDPRTAGTIGRAS